jgi:hypothetical protein
LHKKQKNGAFSKKALVKTAFWGLYFLIQIPLAKELAAEYWKNKGPVSA